MMAPVVGTAVPRKEAVAKVTGRAAYVDDVTVPGMWHGVTVRSTVPRGRITAIHFDPAFPWSEYTIVRAADVPGRNVVALIVDDQPFLADIEIRHAEEPILLIAHPDLDKARQARDAVRIEYELLPPVLRMEDSQQVFKQYTINKGDIDAAFAQPGVVVVEGEYTTGAQEQLYIEPNGMLAAWDPTDGLTIRGSMQCPFYVQRALCQLFNLPAERVRVIQQETGGAFGGKEEYPSLLAGHAALLAWKSGHPVKMIYDREEDMAATTKRHPSRTRHRTAVAQDGTLVGMDIEFVIDGGAYATLSGVVLSRGTIHAAGPYRCPNVRVRSTAYATNTPPHGAFRGFGAPQSIFALERHLNKVAAAVGLTPEELRARNLLRTGDTTATGQQLNNAMDLTGLQERALAMADYAAKRERFARENRGSRRKQGIGFATFMHGAGFTGSGERMLQSKVAVEATIDGRYRVLTSMTEMGQGTNTILAQIAAEALGVGYECIDVDRPDTALVPNSGPTVASRTAMVVGHLVQKAAAELRGKLGQGSPLPLRADAQYVEPPGVHWDDEQYRGEAYGAFSFATYLATVTVDIDTGEVEVTDFVAMQEVGRVLHPVLAAGQIEGGVAQGIGWALYEDVTWRSGVMANNQMTNYIIPTAVDLPSLRVAFEEVPYQHGAMGAKGIGELPMDGPAPAILNAVSDALGISFDRVPLLPEHVLAKLALRSAA